MAANETSTPTSAEIQQDCQAQLNLFTTYLNNINLSLARAGITTRTVSPTLATTQASITGLAV